MTTVRLVLWDIDHTLISSGGVGSEIAAEAFASVTGVAMRAQADISGRTERTIFRETLKLHDLDPNDFAFADYAAALADGYIRHAERLRRRGRALPGAAEALATLAAEPEVMQTVVTGNVKAVAKIKLAVFGLAASIDAEAGGYGDDHEDRAPLVDLAIHRASKYARHPFTPAEVTLVGDTVADVDAARANHVRVIAVATGRHTPEALHHAGATVVLPNLANTSDLLDAVLVR